MPSPFAARLWGGHVVMVVLLAATILLGVWQIDVYEGHRAAAAIDRTHDRPVPLAQALGPDQAFPGDAVGRPVTVSGTWLPDDTVLIAGRDQGGRTGFWVVTPVSVTGTGSALPVVRGWIGSTARLPTAPRGSVRLDAWLQPSQSDADAATSVADHGASGLAVLPDLQTAELVQQVDQDLYDGYAVAEGGVAGLPQAELARSPDAGVWTSLRNLLYGVQWWVFGGFVVLMWWRWLADARAAEAAAGAAVDAASDGGASGEGDRTTADDDPVSTVKA